MPPTVCEHQHNTTCDRQDMHVQNITDSPCFPRPKSPHGVTEAAPGQIVDESIRLNAAQVAQARRWLVHILARRAVEIIRAEEGKT